MSDDKLRTLLNDILKDLFFKILRLQEKTVSRLTGDVISRTEMHALEVIEDNNNITLTQLADKLSISKATASVCITRLAKKDYIDKIKVRRDKRKSILRLTSKGENCCAKHREFHDRMVTRLLEDFKMAEYPELVKGLTALYAFFDDIEKELE